MKINILESGGEKMKIEINSENKHQKFEGFGASGAWWAQSVGKWDSIDKETGLLKKDRISQLLFSKADGIGLRTYRYNLGAGLTGSTKGEYSDSERRAESFDDGKGGIDFSKDETSVYMMKRAVADGADEVIFFVNSPLESLTKNGMGHLGKKEIMRENLSPKNYSAFVKYCLDCCAHFISEGVPVKYISPVNEPFWIWNGGQEGCHYSPKSASRVLLEFAKQMEKRSDLDGLKISGVENGDIRWFNRSYTRNLLKYPLVRKYVDSVDVHSYFLHFPLPFFNNRIAFSKRFKSFMDKKYPDVAIKMSEWCHMKGGRDEGMASALVTANTIIDDLTILNVTSWQHWIACSKYDYCDGLIYVNSDNESFSVTKRYYVTGNFSKYIPFESRRVEIQCHDKDIKAVAFEKDSKITSILINNSTFEKSFVAEYDMLVSVTDKNNSLCETVCAKGATIKITPESVTTIVY